MITIILGFISGAIFGLTGSGGGILATPFLIYGLGVPVHQAIGITLLTLSLTSIFGILKRYRSIITDWQAGVVISITGTLASIIGVKISCQTSAQVLTSLLALFFIIISSIIWFNSLRLTTDRVHYTKSQCYIIFCLIGCIAGFFNGFLGVSGGVIIVSTLTLCMSFSMQRAASISILTIAILSSISAVTHFYYERNLAWEVAILFVAGSISGMIVFSHFSYIFSEKLLKKILAIIIFLIGVSMLFKAILSGS